LADVKIVILVNAINNKSYTGEKFYGLMNFQQTAKVFPTNFIDLSQTMKVFPTTNFINSKAKPQKFSLHYDKTQ